MFGYREGKSVKYLLFINVTEKSFTLFHTKEVRTVKLNLIRIYFRLASAKTFVPTNRCQVC